jgi:hypothetical protein
VVENLWLEEGSSTRPPDARRRRIGLAVAAATCLIVVAVPVAILVSGGSGQRASEATTSNPAPIGHSQAVHQVITALNATTGSGNFDVSYTFGGQHGGPPTATPTTSCGTSGSASMGEVCNRSGPEQVQPVSGTGTIDVEPFALVATSDVSGLGNIVLRDNGTDVWEQGGGDYGLSPGSGNTGPGSSLSGFASLVEGTLGPRQGALAMLGLASPTGYLNLDQAEVRDADPVGTDTVEGVPVDVYQISMTPAEGGQVPGLTSQEQRSVSEALQALATQGYTGSTVRISIDASGFIRRTQTTDRFADGTTMTSEAEFSDFGCAGTVHMPGQSGPSTPPAGCTSPDSQTPTAAPVGGSTTTNPTTESSVASSTATTSLSTSAPTGATPSSTPSTIDSTPSSAAAPLPSGPTTTMVSSPPPTP